MEDKIGVFICTGYGIAEALDVEALGKVATDECSVPFCKNVESCEGSGLESIKGDIEKEGLTKVIIAGISARQTDGGGRFPQGVVVEMVPLREHVVWTQTPNEEDTQMMAEDYLRMYIAKIKKMQMPEPFKPEEEINKSIMVVGGGITGMTSALEAARAGYQVRLVEKSENLGGWLAKQHKSVPTKAPYRELEDTGVDDLIARVQKNSRITVYTSAVTRSIAGAPGLFDVSLASNGNGKPPGEEIDSFRVGAIIQATGWKPKDPRENLPYGRLQDVVLNVDLEEMMKEHGRITRPSDGKEAKSVAFIQCGGDGTGHRPSYCSSICCLTALKQARYLRDQDEGAKAYIFYEFMRTPGQYENFYTAVREDPGVFLTRGMVEDVRLEDDQLVLVAKDTMAGEKIEVKVDLVVVAAGMMPNAADGEAIRALEDAKAALGRAENEEQKAKLNEQIESLQSHEGTEILNLGYRQGPDLPQLEYGFPDSHFICFPYETRRTGIYAAGAVRQPMDGLASREDGGGAALKAIQCVEMTSRGEAVHPRAGDKSYPDFLLQRCTQCKRCTEECPFGVLNEDDKGTPLLRATRCRRCGVCMGACPERIVSFKDFSVDMIVSMIQAVEVPDEFDEKPRILVIMCENDAFPAMDAVGQNRLKYNPWIRVIPVRCLGSVNTAWIKEAISSGFDGVILFGCRYGDDYQCHFIKGSELAASRGENIREKLEQMSMETERVELHQLQISEHHRIPQIFDRFAEMIEEIGMNPFKGM